MKTVGFRRVQRGDEEGLTQLISKVLGDHKDADYWHWKYFMNPAGEHGMIVAIHEDSIVGITGTIPIKIKIDTKSVQADQAIDVAVAKEFRRGRTALMLEKKAREVCIRSNHYFTYAFSVKDTYRLFTTLLSFKGVCPISNMSKVINPEPYLRKKIGLLSLSNFMGFVGRYCIKKLSKKKISLPPGYKLYEIKRFDHRFDDFWHKESDNFQIAIVRDSKYLNWRYIESPIPYKIFCLEKDEMIKGFIVLGCYNEDVVRGRIVDIMIETGREEIIDLLLIQAINYFIEKNVDVIVCWMFEQWPIFLSLKKRGFIKRETPHHLIVRSYETDFPNAHIMDRKRWYLTMGDSDYF